MTDQVSQGFALYQNTSRGLYDELRHYPEREQRWTSAMSAIALKSDFDFVLESFDWNSYPNALIVDIGGACGTISESLALRLPGRRFIVQDSDETLRHSVTVPDVEDRLSFMAHDFFQEQPVKGADIYYFRNVFHKWPDEDYMKIVRNLIPALTPGAHIIIDDFGLQEPPTLPRYLERQQLAFDMRMMIFFGSRERTVNDWTHLLGEADPRFKLMDSKVASSQANVIISVSREPERGSVS